MVPAVCLRQRCFSSQQLLLGLSGFFQKISLPGSHRCPLHVAISGHSKAVLSRA